MTEMLNFDLPELAIATCPRCTYQWWMKSKKEHVLCPQCRKYMLRVDAITEVKKDG